MLILAGTTGRIIRKGNALLLKVGSVVPILHVSQNQMWRMARGETHSGPIMVRNIM